MLKLRIVISCLSKLMLQVSCAVISDQEKKLNLKIIDREIFLWPEYETRPRPYPLWPYPYYWHRYPYLPR